MHEPLSMSATIDLDRPLSIKADLYESSSRQVIASWASAAMSKKRAVAVGHNSMFIDLSIKSDGLTL